MIHKSEIQFVVDRIKTILDVQNSNIVFLGSTGKQEWSGDIDIALSDTRFTLNTVKEKFEHIGKDLKVHYGLQCVSVPMALDEERTTKVDIFVGNTNWLQFAYYSPGDKSNYKGSYRTELIRAVANATTFFEDYEDGEIIAKVGYVFTNTNGLKMVRRARPKKKVGSGRVQEFMNVSDSYWEENFGPDNFTYHSTVNPNEASQWLFGLNACEIQKFEEVLYQVRKMPLGKQKKIQDIYYARFGHTLDETPTK